MIAMSYGCLCGATLPSLDDAQAHADQTGHDVIISGSVTSRRPKPVQQVDVDRRELRQLERDAERLRAEIAASPVPVRRR